MPVWRQREGLSKFFHRGRRLSANQRPVAAAFVHDRAAQDLAQLAHPGVRERRLRVAARPQTCLGVVEPSNLAVRHGQRVVDGRGSRLGGKGGFESCDGQLRRTAHERRTTQPEEGGEETGLVRERAFVRGRRDVGLALVEREVPDPHERRHIVGPK